MQVTVCKSVTLAAKAPKLPGHVATGFPLPSTGRGIEGEGWSYPEPPPARASGGGRSRAATPFACGAGTLWRGFAAGLRMTLLLSKQPNFPKASTAETSRPHAYPWAVGRVTPCAPLLTSKRTSFPQPPPSQCFTLKKHIMQVPVFTTCYVRSQSAQDAGRDATGFPLPSTGRGIEGEGWSYPEPPPARASGGGRSRAATPFACGAGTLWRPHAHRRPGDFVYRLLRRLANPRCLERRAPFHQKTIKTPEISLFTL